MVENIRDVLPIQCKQNKAAKKVPTEDDFIQANALGFGDSIGTVTNRITAETELQSLFEPGSPEYEELNYRIVSGQHQQQCEIDRLKGVLVKPMPKHWYNEKAAAESDDPIDTKICASKKPYFMIWRYPELRSRYNSFMCNAERKCRTELGIDLDELRKMSELTPEQADFKMWFLQMNPVQYSRGVMNRICEMCERYFSKSVIDEDGVVEFDSNILKCGVDYSRLAKGRVENLYREYMSDLQMLSAKTESDEELSLKRAMLQDEYRAACAAACINEDELCDILIDVCYSRERSKQFAWDMVGDLMVRNLLKKNNGNISYPRANKHGSILYCGKRFSLETLCIGGVE